MSLVESYHCRLPIEEFAEVAELTEHRESSSTQGTNLALSNYKGLCPAGKSSPTSSLSRGEAFVVVESTYDCCNINVTITVCRRRNV